VTSSIFGSRLRARAIGWLFSHPGERYFVRQLEALLGEDSTNLSRELARLAEDGVLISETEGRQKYFQANPGCAIFEELKGIAVKTTGVADVLREALTPLRDRIRVAFIYGSQASGTFDAHSDVDVMIIGEVGFSEQEAAMTGVRERLRREVSVTGYPPEEFRRKVAEDHHFVMNVLAGPKVFLIGDARELEAVAGQRMASGNTSSSLAV
jgi:uncharacterized protein